MAESLGKDLAPRTGTHKAAGFKYDELEPGSIRLLRIRPAPTADCNGLITCELIHTPISDDAGTLAPYEALSYTWGTEKTTETILIDGCPFYVRPNLHGAMKTLRKADQDRLMWIDAICINQDNLGERADQVPRMGTIYSRATTVMIYLGGGAFDDTCTLGLKHLRNTLQFISKMDAYVNSQRNAQADVWIETRSLEERQAARAEVLAERYRFMFSREDPLEFIISVSMALASPWWNRVWTLQEVVLAQEPILFCGDEALPWKSFWVFCQHLSTSAVRNVLYAQGVRFPLHLSTSAPCMIEGLIVQGTAAIIEIQAVREATMSRDRKLSLSAAVMALKGRRATDARDMVYGILGLAEKSHDAIIPDYTSGTTRNVYVSAFTRIITEDGDLRCLVWAHVEGPRARDKTLPSWIPDLASFSFEGRRRTIGVGPTSLNRGLCGNPTLNRVFQAAGKSHRAFTTSFSGSDGSTLVAKGIRFDKVIAIGQRESLFKDRDVQGEDDSLEAVLQGWQNMGDRLTEPYPTGIPLDAAFWSTVAVGQKIIGYHPGYNRIDCGSMEDYRLDATDEWIPPRTPEDKERLVKALQDHNIGLRFFVTENRYFGVSTPEVRVGDEVCVLMDAEIPFILRRLETGQYHLVGESYVHGIMDGEAIELAARKSDNNCAGQITSALVSFEIL